MLQSAFYAALLAMTLAITPVAPAYAESGSDLVSRGRVMYQKGRFDEAIEILNNVLPALAENKEKAAAHLILGMVYLAEGKTESAEEEFRQAVSLDPEKKLSKTKYPPDVIRLYNQTRMRNLGSIMVQTVPSDADIYIDGELRGLSPLPVNDLLAQKHFIKIVKQGYRIEEKEFEVNSSERSEFYLELSIVDNIPATIAHTKPGSAREGSSFRVKATVQDDQGVVEVLFYFRKRGETEYERVNMYQVQEGVYEGVAPRDKVFPAGLQYYITALDIGGNTSFEGKPENPFDMSVIELDKEPPRIFHTPLVASSDASRLDIQAKVIDNKQLAYVKLFFRRGTENKYMEVKLKDASQSGDYSATIPGVFMNSKEIHYHLEAADESGNIQFSGRGDAPHIIKMFKVLPYKNGYVVERKAKGDKFAKTVRVNVGTMKGYKKNQVFTVFNAKDRVIDPETGMVLAINQNITGKVKITIPGPTSSEAKIIDETKRYSIQKGDLIRFTPGPPTGVGGYSQKFQVITVTWNQNPEPEVKGYIVYRSENENGPFEKLKKVSGRDEVQLINKGSRRNKLQDGKKYFYRVAAYNEEGEVSDLSETGFVIAKGGPDPPEMVAATSGMIMSIPLRWQRSADKETVGYQIFRSDSKTGEYGEIARVKSSDTTSYKDKPKPGAGHELADGKPYWYKMVSYNKTGTIGNMTEPVSGVSRQKPKPPSNLHVISSAVRSISIAWSRHPEPEISKYRIYRNTSSDGDFVMIKEISGRSVTEHTDKDMSGRKIMDGQAYYYRMTAVNSGGAESELTAAVRGATFGPPPAPASIKAASGLVKEVIVSWDALNDAEVVGYSIYRGESADSLKIIKKIRKRNVYQFKDTGGWNRRLKDGTQYYYSVRSVNSVDAESPVTQIAEAVTKPVPAAPQSLSATQGEVGKTTITWSPNLETDIAHYRVLRSQREDGGFQTVDTVKEISFEDLDLKNGMTYFYRIQAIDKDNLKSVQSEPVSTATKPAPSVPSGLEAAAGSTSVTLSWEKNPETDIDHYIIYSVGIFGKQKVGTAKNDSHIVERLSKGSSYSYVITAVDKDRLMSKPSAPVNVKTVK